MRRIQIHSFHLHLHSLLASLVPGGHPIIPFLVIHLPHLRDRFFPFSFLLFHPLRILFPLLLDWSRLGIRNCGSRGTSLLSLHCSYPTTSLISSARQSELGPMSMERPCRRRSWPAQNDGGWWRSGHRGRIRSDQEGTSLF